jgi:uncharacterized protein
VAVDPRRGALNAFPSSRIMNLASPLYVRSMSPRHERRIANIALRVHASSRANELVGFNDGVLVVRVTAPPVEGRANEAVRRLVAKQLRVPRSAVTIVRGARSRDKVVRVEGLDHRAVVDALAG